MKNISFEIRDFSSGNAVQAAFTFLLSGFLAGAIFNWATHSPALEEFFFVPDGSGRARLGWHAASGLLLACGLAAGFLVSSHRIDFREKPGLSMRRSLSAFALVCASIPLLYLSSGGYAALLLRKFSLMFLLSLVFPPVVALAMCVATKSFRRLPVALLASMFFAAASLAMSFPIMLFLFRLSDEPSQFALDFAHLTFLYSSLSLCFGLWLLRRAREK
ncbi:MAG TPA: hypothetical protein VK400_12990 [Pyrinomonadaceae bacterium]|nr:hypothetical protein [Pyrinomonadaceae bacterium]